MKVAITGKGGVGKTTLASALARTWAQSGHQVVALDADPNPNLAIALGIGSEEAEQLDSVANFLLRQEVPHSHGNVTVSHPALSPVPPPSPPPPHIQMEAEELLERLGVLGPDRVRLLQTGRIRRPSEGCLCCGSHRATRRLFDELSAKTRVIVADLEAGVVDLCWTDPKAEDCVLIVATPDRSSLEVARRAIQVTHDLAVGRVVVVANRIEAAADAAAIRDFLPGSEIMEIPEDATLGAAERRGMSPVDFSPRCPALRGVKSLAWRLLVP